MRRCGVLSLACVVFVLMFRPAVDGQTPDVPTLVDRAIQLLLEPASSDAQCTDGLVSLLDAIVKAAPATRFDGRWLEKIIAARDLVAGGRLGEAATLLNDGYLAVNGGAFAMPAGVRSPGDARDCIREKLSSARSLLAEGRADEAVRRMLEAAVMVVTPIGG